MEKKPGQEFLEFIVDIVTAIIGFGVLGALGVLGYQIYWYLRIGEWNPLSIITALQWMSIEWAVRPDDWLGLHKFLNVFPLCVAVFICAFIPLSILVACVLLWESGKGKR